MNTLPTFVDFLKPPPLFLRELRLGLVASTGRRAEYEEGYFAFASHQDSHVHSFTVEVPNRLCMIEVLSQQIFTIPKMSHFTLHFKFFDFVFFCYRRSAEIREISVFTRDDMMISRDRPRDLIKSPTTIFHFIILLS
jgi:hypothetical protein